MFSAGQRVKIVDINNRQDNEVVTLEYYGTSFFIYIDSEDNEWCCTIDGWEVYPIDEVMLAELINDIYAANSCNTRVIAECLYNMGWRKETI